LLLHVIDASDRHHEDRRRQVEGVLAEIGAAEVPCLRVYNKLDRAPPDFVRELDGAATPKHCVSAVTGEGVAALKDAIRARVAGVRVAGELRLTPDQSRLRARLFGWHAVRGERVEADGSSTLAVDLPAQRWRQLKDEEGLSADSIRPKV
jgi:GTP-binding protein HflX